MLDQFGKRSVTGSDQSRARLQPAGPWPLPHVVTPYPDTVAGGMLEEVRDI